MFTGAVPPEWGDISELKFLDIGGNLLTGTLVTTLGRLTNLENFWIESNGFSGQLTIGVSPTANLSKSLYILARRRGLVNPTKYSYLALLPSEL